MGALYSGEKISKLLILVNRGIVLITSHVVFSFLEHFTPLPLLVAKAVNYAAANLEMKIVPEIQYTFLTYSVGFIGSPLKYTEA